MVESDMEGCQQAIKDESRHNDTVCRDDESGMLANNQVALNHCADVQMFHVTNVSKHFRRSHALMKVCMHPPKVRAVHHSKLATSGHSKCPRTVPWQGEARTLKLALRHTPSNHVVK